MVEETRKPLVAVQTLFPAQLAIMEIMVLIGGRRWCVRT